MRYWVGDGLGVEARGTVRAGGLGFGLGGLNLELGCGLGLEFWVGFRVEIGDMERVANRGGVTTW